MAKSEEDESAEAAGNVRAKDLAGKARKASKAKASEVFVAEAPQDALAKPSQREVAEAMEESSTAIEEEGGAEAASRSLSATLKLLLARRRIRRPLAKKRLNPLGSVLVAHVAGHRVARNLVS